MMMMRTSVSILASMMALASCRSAGLPPEAPEHDATNPEVGLVEAGPSLHPLTRSAFEGEALEDEGGHEHHHHHGHGKAAAKGTKDPKAASAPAEAEAEPEPSGHEGHEGHEGHAGHGDRS